MAATASSNSFLIAPQLPEDIEINILLRLPVSSLLRCRSVCKSWHDAISNPSFITRHYDRVVSTNSQFTGIPHVVGLPLCIDSSYYRRKFIVSDEINDFFKNIPEQTHSWKKPPRILGPCYGIYCLSEDSPGGNSAFWNPATGEVRFFPSSAENFRDPPACHSRDHHRYFIDLSFGFDSKTKDYKMIRFFSANKESDRSDDGLGGYELYSLKANSWRKTRGLKVSILSRDGKAIQPKTSGVMFGNNAYSIYAYLNGFCYWLVFVREIGYEYAPCILAFDVSSEAFHMLSCPPLLPSGSLDHCIKTHVAVLEESLALVVGEKYEQEQHFTVWVMPEVDVVDSWTIRYRVGPLSGIQHFVGFWNNTGLLISEIKSWHEGAQVWLHDLSTQPSTSLRLEGEFLFSNYQVLRYMESLYPIQWDQV